MDYNDILSLDVGGTRFKTTRQTLLKDPESMLARMFDPDSQIPPAQIQDGAYFLDRDPSMFNLILKFLRSGKLVEKIPDEVLAELQDEAEYFQISSLLEIINQRLDEMDVIEFVLIRDSRYQLQVQRSLIGNIPLTTFIKVLNLDDNPNPDCIPKLIKRIELDDYVEYCKDSSGYICIDSRNVGPTIKAIEELKDKKYTTEKAKLLVLLRDYYYTDQSEFNIKVDNLTFKCKKSTFKCKKSALVHLNFRMISENGDLVSFKSPRICPRQRNECQCDHAHETTPKDLVERILRRLESNRVGDGEPPVRTELREDSYAARIMGLLPGYTQKWFY